MKFSPLPTTGVAVAAVAAISATAVALKKKGKKITEPITSFTAKEWEELKDWPAVKSLLKDSGSTKEDAEEAKQAEYSDSDSKEGMEKDTAEETTSPADDQSEEKEKESVKNTEYPVAQVVIGDGPGQVKAFGAEYKKIINRAFKEASNDDTVTLELFGKTYGLGAKGQKIEDAPLPGTLYNAEDITKLHKKLAVK